jgi:hypothetical protein
LIARKRLTTCQPEAASALIDDLKVITAFVERHCEDDLPPSPPRPTVRCGYGKVTPAAMPCRTPPTTRKPGTISPLRVGGHAPRDFDALAPARLVE